MVYVYGGCVCCMRLYYTIADELTDLTPASICLILVQLLVPADVDDVQGMLMLAHYLHVVIIRPVI